ncbi:MAG: FAD-dependent oxidoreductase [Bacteroidetes bacterium]|jgi:protoporphyrinogen oxidase|nr:FAD-dependent oxidoreductase [Bacteroidota bacterium]
MRSIIIVGGGITGLSAAYIAAKSGRKVRVIEAKEQFGGLLNTFPIGGNRLEFFYHHFFTHDVELLWLLRELKLEDQIIWDNTQMGIYRNKKIYSFNSPTDLLKFKPISFFGKIRFGLTSFFLGKFADWQIKEGISALDWFYKYAGKSVTDSIWKPLLDIKFGPYANEVPLSWMIGRLRQRMNSRKKGAEQLGYLDGSLQILLDALLKELKDLGVELISGAPVLELIIENQTLNGIITEKGIFKNGDFLFTIPTVFLTKLLEKEAPKYAQKLNQIEYFGAVCTILEMKKPLSDFYWLNIADSGFPFGGVIEHTNLINAKNYNHSHIAYLSRYFASTEPIYEMTNEEISELMVEKIKIIFPDFDFHDLIKIHVFRTNTAATVCDKFFSKKIPKCMSPIRNLFLSNMAHVYPDERSANNSIRIAAEACKVMGISAEIIPQNASLSGKIGF